MLFSLLGPVELATLQRVSKAFNQLQYEPVESLSFDAINQDNPSVLRINGPGLAILITKCPNLKSLDLTGCSNIE